MVGVTVMFVSQGQKLLCDRSNSKPKILLLVNMGVLGVCKDAMMVQICHGCIEMEGLSQRSFGKLDVKFV